MRRHARHTLYLTPYYDTWLAARMTERGQGVKEIVQELIGARIEGRGIHLSSEHANDVAGHANAQRLIVSSLKLVVRNPDHLRSLADLDSAAAAIGRIVNPGRR